MVKTFVCATSDSVIYLKDYGFYVYDLVWHEDKQYVNIRDTVSWSHDFPMQPDIFDQITYSRVNIHTFLRRHKAMYKKWDKLNFKTDFKSSKQKDFEISIVIHAIHNWLRTYEIDREIQELLDTTEYFDWCNECGEVFLESNLNYIDYYGMICDSCKENEFIACDYCGVLYKKESDKLGYYEIATYSDDEIRPKNICENCNVDIWTCGECDKSFAHKDIFADVYGEYYCCYCIIDGFDKYFKKLFALFDNGLVVPKKCELTLSSLLKWDTLCEVDDEEFRDEFVCVNANIPLNTGWEDEFSMELLIQNLEYNGLREYFNQLLNKFYFHIAIYTENLVYVYTPMVISKMIENKIHIEQRIIASPNFKNAFDGAMLILKDKKVDQQYLDELENKVWKSFSVRTVQGDNQMQLFL